MTRWRRRADGFLKPYVVAALGVLVLGVCCVLIELQSPSLILWTGQPVPGTNDGGIIYYTVDGEQRTLTADGPAPDRPLPVTVYVDPDDWSRDRADRGSTRWFDAGFVAFPFLAAGAVLGVGLIRRRRFVVRAPVAPLRP